MTGRIRLLPRPETPAMWSTLAVAALAVAPAQPAGGGLQLLNARATIGELGPPRPDTRILPGDFLFLAFDIDGITVEPNGTARYTMAMELLDPAGKKAFTRDPQEIGGLFVLGGSRIPARTFVSVGIDQDPGTYTCNITVTDPKTKRTGSLSRKFEVLKRDFGVVAVYTSYDDRGLISAPTTGQVGQTVFVWFSTVGFARDPKTKQPNVAFEFTTVDESGRPTLAAPLKDVADAGVDEKEGGFARNFPLFMSRPGKFTVRVKATDKVANRVFATELPVVVEGPK